MKKNSILCLALFALLCLCSPASAAFTLNPQDALKALQKTVEDAIPRVLEPQKQPEQPQSQPEQPQSQPAQPQSQPAQQQSRPAQQQSQPAQAAASKLPAGFIALSETEMNMSDGMAYCRQQGGKLPRINNSDSLARGASSGGGKTNLDGFGNVGSNWPSGLPCDTYWTGTTESSPGRAWIITCNDPGTFGKPFSRVQNASHQSWKYRVVCVP